MSQVYVLETRTRMIRLLDIDDDEPGCTIHAMIHRDEAVALLAEHGATADHLPPPGSPDYWTSWDEAAPGLFVGDSR
jgi:hypothetical protein